MNRRRLTFGGCVHVVMLQHGTRFQYTADLHVSNELPVPDMEEVIQTPALTPERLLEFRMREHVAAELRRAADHALPPEPRPGVGGRKRCSCGRPLRELRDVLPDFDRALEALRVADSTARVAAAASRLLIVRMLLVACPACVLADTEQALGVTR